MTNSAGLPCQGIGAYDATDKVPDHGPVPHTVPSGVRPSIPTILPGGEAHEYDRNLGVPGYGKGTGG
jgi:hypothetical protein